MDPHKLIELGERMAQAFNSSDWAAYSAAMTDDATYESPRAQARGPEQILEFVKGAKVAYPDMKATAINALTCGNTLVRELTWEGTNSGPMTTPQGTIPPTNRRIIFKGVVLLETLDDGSVVAIREYYDRAAIMAQLGSGASAPTATG